MADDKQFPPPQPPVQPQAQPQFQPAQYQQPPYQQPAAPRAGISGTTQVITAAIGAIATISGALIAANWGRGGSHDLVRPTPVPTLQQQPAGGDGVFPPSSNGGSSGGASGGGETGDAAATDASALLGQWRGQASDAAIAITQNQDGTITVTSQATTPQGVLASTGQGQISGNVITWNFQNNANSTGQCQAQLSADGHQLQGGCRHANGFTEPVMLVR